MPLVVLVTLLVGCASPARYIEQHGTPDLIYEEAGDMGRYRRGDDNGDPAYLWRPHLTRLYYLRTRTRVTFEERECTVELLDEQAMNAAARLVRDTALSRPDDRP
jgi:hypothetical protein